MNLTRDNLNKAVAAKILSAEQADNLIAFIKNLPDQAPGFNLTNVLYYFGGLIAIGAMTLSMNLGWELYGGWGIFFLCCCYGILGLALSQQFAQKGLRIPAGICATFVICLTPLGIYGLQNALGWWPDNKVFFEQYNYYINWSWLLMELGTLLVGLILAWIYRYPFMIMPIAVTLWYMSMDVAAMISTDFYSFELKAMISMYFGLLTVLLAFWVDVRSSKSADYAFWLYIFGVMAFWGGLTSQHSDSELSKFLYFCINVGMILTGVLLSRKVFVVFGAFGCCFYIGYLAFQVFQDSYLFPVVLSAIGLAVIYLGIIWQKHEARLTVNMRSILPTPLRDLLQARDNMD